MRRLAVCAGVGLAVVGCWAQRSVPRLLEYPSPAIREEQTVRVNGSEEVWRLVWKTLPVPECGPDELSFTCPCTGFAFGEAGDLELVRLRGGLEKDRLNLTAFYWDLPTGSGHLALVQRWAVADNDIDTTSLSSFAESVAKRPAVQVMHLADFDHDGKSEEFFLHTENEPCGKPYGVVVGITAANGRLHVFGTAAHPEQPLRMSAEAWTALRDAHGPVETVEWPCGDHGSDQQTEVRLSWSAQGIEATERTFGCTGDMKRGGLLREEKL